MVFWSYLDVATKLRTTKFGYDLLQVEGYEEHLERMLQQDIPFSLCRLTSPGEPFTFNIKQLQSIEDVWKYSPERAAICDSLAAALKSRPSLSITKIVCFVSGAINAPVSLDDENKMMQSDLVHRLVALDIAALLKTQFNKSVPVTFQPFINEDQVWIRRLAVDRRVQIGAFKHNPNAILDIDEHTLVLATGRQKLPIRQIVVDVTKPIKGPAGFFCQSISKITSDHDEWNLAKDLVDAQNRRVTSMPVDYDMDKVCCVDVWNASLYLKE